MHGVGKHMWDVRLVELPFINKVRRGDVLVLAAVIVLIESVI